MTPRSIVASMRGLSLVELMVALAIGSFLVIGAVTVYSNGRNTYALTESIGRLQENGRYVMSVLEPDLELAGYYAFTNSPDTLRFVSGANPAIEYAGATGMRQRAVPAAGVAPAPLAALPASAHACGNNFAVDVLSPVEGTDDEYLPNAGAGCAPYSAAGGAGTAEPETDTLTVRRASTTTVPAEAGRIQLYASRLRSRTVQQLFVDGVAPGLIDDDNDVHNLVVRSYYVASDSVDRPGFPALRVKALSSITGAATFIDNEVMPGVEDLQVQFGIDTGDYDNDGVIDPGMDLDANGIPESDGRATRYVGPDFPDLDLYQIVAVRVWVRVRADQPDPGFRDDREYEYAGRVHALTDEERRFRRVLLSRTIALRNARTL